MKKLHFINETYPKEVGHFFFSFRPFRLFFSRDGLNTA